MMISMITSPIEAGRTLSTDHQRQKYPTKTPNATITNDPTESVPLQLAFVNFKSVNRMKIVKIKAPENTRGVKKSTESVDFGLNQ